MPHRRKPPKNGAFLTDLQKHGVIVLAISLLAVFSLRRVLWGNWAYDSDATFWYALFHYFSNSLYYGHLPLWNPYMSGGEPFWPVLGLWRLLDPVNVSAVLLARAFGYSDLFHLYKLVFFVNSLLCVVGVSTLIFQLTKRFVASFLASLLFTNFYFTTLATDFNYVTVYVFPFALVFWIRFVETGKSRDFLIFAYLVGLYVGSASYHAISGIFMLLVAGGALLVPVLRERSRSLRSWVRELLGRPRMLAAGALTVIAMSTPFIVSGFYDAFRLFPIARVADNRAEFENPERAIASYRAEMNSGRHTSVDGLVASLIYYPDRRPMVARDPNTSAAVFHPDANKQSRIYAALRPPIMFIWLIGVAWALILRWRIALPLCGISCVAAFLALGTNTPVHGVLTTVFPPLVLVRNTIGFESFIFIFLAVTQGIGWAAIETRFARPVSLTFRGTKPDRPAMRLGTTAAIAATVVCLTAFAANSPYFIGRAAYIPEAPLFPDFDFKAQDMNPLGSREFAMARTGWFLLEPILYHRNTALQMMVVPPKGTDIPSDRFPYYLAWEKAKPEKNRFGPVYGLRDIFWTKDYTAAYKAGERDIDTFNSLLAVNRPYVDFQSRITLAGNLSLHDVARMAGQCAVISPTGNGDARPTPVPIAWTANADCAPSVTVAADKPAAASVHLATQTPSAFGIKVQASSSGLVVVHDSFDTSWYARVDGKPADIYKVNLLSKGVFVPPGTHDVTLIYRPWPFLISVILFYAMIVGFPLALIFGGNRKAA